MKKQLPSLVMAFCMLLSLAIPALASGGYSAPYPGNGDNGKDTDTVEITIPGDPGSGEIVISPINPGDPGNGDVVIQPVPAGVTYRLFRDGEAPRTFVQNNDGVFRPALFGDIDYDTVSQYVGFENTLVLVRQNGDEKTVLLPFDMLSGTLEVLDSDEMYEQPDGTIAYRPAVGGTRYVFDTIDYADERDAVSISLLSAYISDNSVQLWTDNTAAASKLTASVVLPFLELAGLPLPEVREVRAGGILASLFGTSETKIVFPGNRQFSMEDSLRSELALQYGLWAFRLNPVTYMPINWNQTGIGPKGDVIEFQNSLNDCLLVSNIDGEAAA